MLIGECLEICKHFHFSIPKNANSRDFRFPFTQFGAKS